MTVDDLGDISVSSSDCFTSNFS